VKQCDLREYEENTWEKQTIQVYKAKSPTPPETKAKQKLPLKPSHVDGNTKFQTQEGNKKSTRFLNAKDHTPPEPKAKHNKRQIQPKTWTPPEVENPRFYQISLDKPQVKHRPLKQQSNSKRIWPRHKSHKSKNNHQLSQAKPTRHPQQEKCGPLQQLISKQGRNQPTESHIYTGDEHHDGTNMGHNQGIVTQSGEQIKPHKKQV
jgi:hypothetical protein